MLKLRKMDPMEVDPAQFKVAVRTDTRIGIPKDGVHISLKFNAEDDSLNIDDTYVVEVIRNPVFTPELYDDKATGQSVTVLQLSDNDARKMAHVQSLISPYVDGRAAGTLSFGVDVKDLCAHSPVLSNKVLVDVFVQANDGGDFFVVARDLNLAQSVEGSKPVLDNMSPCPESPIHSD